MSRLFTKTQKRALIVDAEKEGEADHIIPYSRGGQTDVVNGQILTSTENRKKAATQFKPREWQQRMLQSWINRPIDSKGYLAVCAPGSGKTSAALMIVRRWLNGARDRKVIIVVPSKNLQLSWRDIANKFFQINLETEDCSSNKHGFHGSVTTYQGVSSAHEYIRKRVSQSDTMVIFDEVHHCSDRNDWGGKLNNAFGYACEVLMLSGTPWRTDKHPISFATYGSDGLVKADFTFTYPEARQAGHIRRPSFSFEAGKVTEVVQNRSYVVSLDVPEDDQTDFRLTPLVATDDGYIRRLIEKGHNALKQARQQRPQAGGIIMCIDIPHAQRVAALVKKITGDEAVIICSDPEIENSTVDQFRKSDAPWLVTVKKVSEGTDIPRLEVLVWLTNVVSGTFFHQAVGRVIRKQSTNDDIAQVILPAFATYEQYAKNMDSEFGPAIEVDKTACLDERGDIERQLNQAIYQTFYLGTEMICVDGISISPETFEKAKQISDLANIPVETGVRIMIEYNPNLVLTNAQIETAVHDEVNMPLEDKLKYLRRKIQNEAISLARKIREKILTDRDLSWHISRIHYYLNDGIKQEEMSESQLERKLRDVMYYHNNPDMWRSIYE